MMIRLKKASAIADIVCAIGIALSAGLLFANISRAVNIVSILAIVLAAVDQLKNAIYELRRVKRLECDYPDWKKSVLRGYERRVEDYGNDAALDWMCAMSLLAWYAYYRDWDKGE